MILLRTTEPSKKCLREAADRAGLTLTSFILRAALREAVGSDDAGILSRYLLQDGLAQDEIERAATHPFDALLQHAAVIDSSGIVKAYQESRANTPNDAGLDRRLDVPPPLNELAPAAARGGAVNYRKVGRVLAEHTLRYLGATNATAWWKRNADLRASLRAGDLTATLAWYVEHFPGCLALVPKRRRQLFAMGVLDAYRSRAMGQVRSSG